MKNIPPCIFLLEKRRSNDDVGMARITGFQALRPGAGFKTGDFVKKKYPGGAIVVRLHRTNATYDRGGGVMFMLCCCLGHLFSVARSRSRE